MHRCKSSPGTFEGSVAGLWASQTWKWHHHDKNDNRAKDSNPTTFISCIWKSWHNTMKMTSKMWNTLSKARTGKIPAELAVQDADITQVPQQSEVASTPTKHLLLSTSRWYTAQFLTYSQRQETGSRSAEFAVQTADTNRGVAYVEEEDWCPNFGYKQLQWDSDFRPRT